MVWYQAEVAGTIIVQTLPVIRHLARDESVQKSLVSVQLNEIRTTMGSKIWDGRDPDVAPYSFDAKWKDLESGSLEDDRSLSGRKIPYLDPKRSSWSTFSPIKRQI